MTPISFDDIVSYMDAYIVPSLRGESKHPFFSFAIPSDTEMDTLDLVKEHYEETYPLMVIDVEPEDKHISITTFLKAGQDD